MQSEVGRAGLYRSTLLSAGRQTGAPTDDRGIDFACLDGDFVHVRESCAAQDPDFIKQSAT